MHAFRPERLWVGDWLPGSQSWGMNGGRRTAVSQWYQPHQEWPRHPKPWWRDTLEHARSAGWHLKTIDGHSWGRIVCDPEADQPCRIMVFSTGTAAESVARDACKTIDRCGHIAVRASGQVLARATVLLDQADCLIKAAEGCLQAADKQTEARELLDSVVTVAAEVDALLDQVMKLEAEGDALIVAVFKALPADSQLGCPPSTQEVELLVVEAEARADEAQELVDDLPLGHPVDLTRERIAQVRARLGELFRRLSPDGNADGTLTA